MTNVQESGFQVKRIFDPPLPEDGVRILVDRLWPRGVSKEQASIDEWIKEIAPSHELRQWFGHQLERFPEFSERYERELEEDPARRRLAERLLDMAAGQTVTLIYSAKDPVHNQAVVLQNWLSRQRG